MSKVRLNGLDLWKAYKWNRYDEYNSMFDEITPYGWECFDRQIEEEFDELLSYWEEVKGYEIYWGVDGVL